MCPRILPRLFWGAFFYIYRSLGICHLYTKRRVSGFPRFSLLATFFRPSAIALVFFLSFLLPMRRRAGFSIVRKALASRSFPPSSSFETLDLGFLFFSAHRAERGEHPRLASTGPFVSVRHLSCTRLFSPLSSPFDLCADTGSVPKFHDPLVSEGSSHMPGD